MHCGLTYYVVPGPAEWERSPEANQYTNNLIAGVKVFVNRVGAGREARPRHESEQGTLAMNIAL